MGFWRGLYQRVAECGPAQSAQKRLSMINQPARDASSQPAGPHSAVQITTPNKPNTYQGRRTPSTRRTRTTDDETGSAGIESEKAVETPSGWVVYNIGTFNHFKEYTFENGTIPEGLQVSTCTVEDEGMPFSHIFQESNVYVDKDGILNLKVPGNQNPKTNNGYASCAEIETVEDQIQCGSVRTIAIFSDVPGTCHGLFFYKSDNQEIDIEYLTDRTSLSNPGDNAPANLQYTNQAIQPSANPTQAFVDSPEYVTNWHEYRIDWCKDKTLFYTDGKLMATLKTNVPTVPGQWIWNNWCNGDQGWSCGPPKKDNIMRIKKITMYYNLATDDTS